MEATSVHQTGTEHPYPMRRCAILTIALRVRDNGNEDHHSQCKRILKSSAVKELRARNVDGCVDLD